MKERLADLFYGLVLLWFGLCLAAAYVACAAFAGCFGWRKERKGTDP